MESEGTNQRPGVGALWRALRSQWRPDDFETPARTEEDRPVAEGRRMARRPRADVYLPPRRARSGASVVVVHGGGFTVGQRRMRPVRLVTSHLVAAGYAVCATDYRRLTDGARFSDSVADVEAGLRWWSGRAPEHGLDPERVALLGISAGATLAMTVAAGVRPGVCSTVAIFGLYDVTHLRGPFGSVMPRRLFATADRAAWRARLPLHGPTPEHPVLLVHGDADQVCPVEQARALRDRRAAAGLPTTLVELPGEPHAFLNLPTPATPVALDAIARFLEDEQAREDAMRVG